MTKQCAICKIVKALEEYNKHSARPDGLQNVCRDCNRKRSRQYYKENKDKHKKAVQVNTRKYLKRNRELIIAAKSVPCTDCGITYPSYVMDLDHVVGDKVGALSCMARYSTKEAILTEIAKCEVVCANCHRIRTFTRLGATEEDVI